MKKVFILSVLLTSIFFLTSCSQNPFRALPDTEIEYNDVLTFDYFNGKITKELFHYQFSQDYYFFKGTIDHNYRFTSINNYLEISNDFIAFLDTYDDMIIYDKFFNESYGDSLRLSLGATDGNYNLETISSDGDIYDVDAYMTLENGMRMIFSYTEFYHNNQLIIVPYYLSFITYEIHEASLKEYLPSSNDYSDKKAILTKYHTILIPLPPKVGKVESTFNDKTNDLKDLGNFLRLEEDFSNTPSKVIEVCSTSNQEDCFNPEFSTLNGIIYDYSILEIITFYETYYHGSYQGDNFTFMVDDFTFLLTLEQTNIIKDDDEIPVISFIITIYQD